MPMDEWFNKIATQAHLPEAAARQLGDDGYVVLEGVLPPSQCAPLAAAYDAAMQAADPADVRVGSTTTRVHDFFNRGPAFDELYLYGPMLAACCQIRTSLQAQQFARKDTATRRHDAAFACRLQALRRGLADGWLHLDGG